MTYIKYIYRGFKNNLSRFISVIAIISLGIGFLVGLSTSSSDILDSVNNNYIESNTMDLNLKSTIGFSNETVVELNTTNSIAKGVYINDNPDSTLNDKKLNTRLISTDLQSNEINRTTLIKGSFPKNKNECVVLEDLEVYSKAEIGDFIKVNDIYTNSFNTYTVVGIVKSSIYFSKTKELDNTYTKNLDLIFYLDSNYQDFPITDIFVKYNDLENNKFKENYFNSLEEYVQDLNTEKEDMLLIRKEEILSNFENLITLNIESEIRKNLEESGESEDKILLEINSELGLKSEEIKSSARKEYNLTYGTNEEEIYILSIKNNQSYNLLVTSTDKIDKIAIIFPMFFYFIAGLVSLTTITRLVDEERKSLGIFKSLGYSKFKIVLKYLIYGLLCSIFGSLIGNLLGVYLLPYGIFNSFTNIFSLPKIVFNINSTINIVSIIIMILTILVVSLYVSLTALKARPAELLLPKNPKPGKRIFLEHIPLIWKRTPFKYKNMLRNIFRYKKNLIMMIIGVGGCVSLLLCSFSVREEFNKLASTQYNEVILYDLEVSYDNSTTPVLNEIVGINSFESVHQDKIYLSDERNYQINRVITNKNISNYFNYSINKTELSLNDGDTFIDEQTSIEFNLNIGDTIVFNDIEKEYVITGIYENHVNNYIFIYDSTNTTDKNTFFVNVDKGEISNIINDLELLNTTNIIQTEALIDQSEQMLNSIVLILIVVIACSAILAIIVIYNLTNININERVKEIATLKVLGYQNHEVYLYIFREIFVLSLFGIIVGFLLGPILNKFVISTVQAPGYFLSDVILPIYYLSSFLITLLIILVVDLLFIKKIKNVKMVESLKCIE